MTSSQGAAQITSHCVLTNTMPVQPGMHKNLVGAGFANSMADVVHITTLKILLCCIAKSKLYYAIVTFQHENPGTCLLMCMLLLGLYSSVSCKQHMTQCWFDLCVL